MRQKVILRCVAVLVFASLFLVLVTGEEHAQERRGSPIRVRVTEVPVDVIATDRNGRPVTDLRKADFVLLEDGVEQQILHFAPISYPTEPSHTRPKHTATVATNEQLPTAIRPPDQRTFLIFIGRGRHYQNSNALPMLIRFVREQLGPSDRVAVMAYSRASDFTTDHNAIARTLERYTEISQDIEPKLTLASTGLAAVYARKTLLKPFQSRIDRIFEGAIASRRVVPNRGSAQSARERQVRDLLGDSVRAESQDLARNRMRDQQRVISGNGDATTAPAAETPQESADYLNRTQLDLVTDGLPFDEFVAARSITEQDVEQLYAAISYLRFMVGEKHLLFMTEDGLVLPSMEDDRGLGRIASDARVRIHTLLTSGVNTSSGGSTFDASYMPGTPTRGGPLPGFWTAAKALSLQSLENLSNITGGNCFIHREVGQALREANQTTSFFYLLGYVPADPDTNGRFRRIEVQLQRPGVTLHYRRGYFAHDDLKLYDSEQLITHTRVSTALQYEGQLQDVKFTLEAKKEYQGNPPKARVRMITRLMPGADLYKQEADRYNGKLHVSYFVVSRNGSLLAETSDDVVMALRQPSYEKVMREGMVLSKELEVEDNGKPLQVKLVVYDAKNDRLGVDLVSVE